jgi:hypothetical protein
VSERCTRSHDMPQEYRRILNQVMAINRRSGRTFSESAFEIFCEQVGLPLSRIPERATKTPDYLLTIDRSEIVVEIKETEKNKVEEESDRVLRATGVGKAICVTPGAKVRAMITAASPQIKRGRQGDDQACWCSLIGAW